MYKANPIALKASIIALALILSGCAGNASVKNPELTSYAKVSQGHARGLVSFFTGSGEYCMVQTHNLENVRFKLDYEDGACSGSVVSP